MSQESGIIGAVANASGPHNKNPTERVHWLRLVLVFIGVFLLSAVLSGVILYFVRSHFSLSKVAWLAYVSVFGVTLLINLSFVPLPFAISVMIAAAARWNPLLIALVGSLGASIGEMSGYYAGVLGKKIAIPDELSGYKLMQRWIQKYGVWAIAFLSFQPLLPIEVGVFIAGAARMSVRKFLPALWLGKYPKYIILMYGGLGLIRLLPFLRQ